MASRYCPDCGEAAGEGFRFCENCGAALRSRRTPEGGPLGPVAPGCVSCGETVSADGFCEQCGRAQPTGRDRMEFDLGFVAGVSDRGRSRVRNEDSMAFATLGPKNAPEHIVAVVCDGVGSTERADEASQAAVDAALAAFLDALGDGRDPYESTVDAAAAAFAAVRGLARSDSPDLAPSSTFVSAVVTAGEVTVGWIGDSRAYWLSGGTSRQLTTDDTLYAQLLAADVPEEEAAAEPNAHALVRWVGADAQERLPNVLTLPADTPGTLVLCSDGLWNYLPTAESIAAKTPDAPPLAVAAELTATALAAGGGDNITVVVVPHPFDQQGSADE
ncbi:PP2C family serine/threonine-protein phosphatase [Amycolatopsis sp.]|uniref:PP2C family serine/threonine-protein phosphatase n=1 Tax=Amycolatopsis sp. TaxID=37632 RepID=UPI002C97870D|nr:protein phosphatase 2C domain-containing protein [Amycolatopsis sp.]HVV13418.1 protein phosphatase 2C domain-containing protein [Amycolatopsis sp.]